MTRPNASDEGTMRDDGNERPLTATYRLPEVHLLDESLQSGKQQMTKKVKALDEKQAKVQESEAKGHGQRLAQRQHALGRVEQDLKDAAHPQGHLEAQVKALPPPKERANGAS